MNRLFVACALVAFTGCPGEVGDEASFDPGEWNETEPDGGGFDDPGTDGGQPTWNDSQPKPDSQQPAPDTTQPEPKCIKKNNGSCCLEGKPCTVPTCPDGTLTQYFCKDDCTTGVKCTGDPVEPECELKNGRCCLDDDCVNTTLNVTCESGYEPGELYCTKSCMPMRDCVPSPTNCVEDGTECCTNDGICTKLLGGACSQGTAKFLGCSTACVPQYDCII